MRLTGVRDVIQRYYIMNATELRVVSNAHATHSNRENGLRYAHVLVRLNGSNLLFGMQCSEGDSRRERDAPLCLCPCNMHHDTCILCDRSIEPTECDCPCPCANELQLASQTLDAASQSQSASTANHNSNIQFNTVCS